MLGAASRRLPVLVDGFICSAAYVAALHICPQLADYAVLSHASAEPGHVRALSKLTGGEARNNPLLHLSMSTIPMHSSSAFASFAPTTISRLGANTALRSFPGWGRSLMTRL